MANKIQQAFEEKAFGKPTLVPRFFEHARLNNLKTKAYGVNVYETHTYLEIKTAGRKDTTTRKATDEDKELFVEHFTKYTEGTQYSTIPMEALPGYSIANRFTLRDMDITTVEELAEYESRLPLGSLKLMQHAAQMLVGVMAQYEPPTFHDDVMEVPRETIQTQRQVLPADRSIAAPDGQTGDHGGGVQRFGVTLDEDGNAIEVLGGETSEEKGVWQEESQQKESQPKVLSFY